VPGYAVLPRPAGWAARLLLQRRDSAAPGDRTRGHVDFGCTDAGALDRHVALGARVTGVQQHWTVLTDPAGHEYCLVGRDPA
jgi:Glyoxalase-like domain